MFNILKTINSQFVSGFVCLPCSPEPDAKTAESGSYSGVFAGISARLSMPVFIDYDEAINPHVLICGMTGSGKTFFARSIVIRSSIFSDCGIIIIDFTGEYRSITDAISSDATSINDSVKNGIGVCYICLDGMDENEKVSKASDALDSIASAMRRRKPGGRRLFILLDEAWKLIERNKGLETIIREGRKYGVGLITSSQLLHDTNSNILSNVATIFIFKTTNLQSLEKLSRSYNLSEEETNIIKDMDRGSCFLIQSCKSGKRHAFQIKKVVGINEGNYIAISVGNGMEVRMDMEGFDHMVGKLCGNKKTEIMNYASAIRRIELPLLIRKIYETGADRIAILKEIEGLGFSRSDIADAFSIALNVDSDGSKK